jgi:hypothetical protein
MEAQVGPMLYADANPTDKRLKLFQRLAKLKLDPRKTFDKWAAEEKIEGDEALAAFKVWQAAWDAIKVEYMFDLLRITSVFDESFRLPSLKAGSEEFQGNVERKFADLMARISLLTLTIQKEQEELTSEQDLAILSNSSSERNSIQ